MGEMKYITNLTCIKVLNLQVLSVLSINAISETFQLGDLAPRGVPDGQLDISDSFSK